MKRYIFTAFVLSLSFYSPLLLAKSPSARRDFNLADYKFGYFYEDGKLKWAPNLCESVDVKDLKSSDCKKAKDNIGNKSIRCNHSVKKAKIALYPTLDDCKVDLQMATEGNDL